MIAHLTGTVSQVGGTWVDIDLGGFGVRALATPATVASVRVGETATLATSLVVRQDSLTLFGFSDPEERDAFELVQSASGIGPKLAQAVVSVLPPAELRAAIILHDLFDCMTGEGGVDVDQIARLRAVFKTVQIHR